MVLDSIYLGTGNCGSPSGAYAWRERKFYTRGGPDSTNLFVIDVATDSVLRILPLPGAGPDPQNLVYHSATNRLYIVTDNVSTHSVAVLNCANDSLEALIPDVGVGRATWDSLEDKLYVDNHAPGLDRLIVIDCSTNTIIDTVHNCPEGDYAASYTRRHRLYCPGEWGSIGIVDTETDSLVTILPIQTDQYHAMVVCNEQEDKVYIGGRPNSSPQGDSVYVLDCAGDTVLYKLWLDSSAYISSLALAPWSNRLYCQTSRGRLFAIDCATDSVIGRQLHYGAGTLAAHPDNHRIYLAAYWEACVYVFRDEPNGVAEPGTSPSPPRLSFGVQPNPTRGALRLILPSSLPHSFLSVFSATGRLVLARPVPATAPAIGHWDMELGSLPAGVYVVTLATASGTLTRKLVLGR
jgi:DNA-binding beta-propeller fold protein YncE